MKEEDILQGMSEIYFYNCSRCGQGNLSRDEVFATKLGGVEYHKRGKVIQLRGKEYICLKCHARLSNGVDR